MPRATALVLRSGAMVVTSPEAVDRAPQHGDAGGIDAVVVGEEDLQGHGLILAEPRFTLSGDRPATPLTLPHAPVLPGDRL